MARNHPPLKLRRGTEAAILAANVSDFEVGEPIFAQDTGKLFIKTTAGTLEEISGSGDGPGGDSVWGQITGTLSNQTDLQAALDLKVDLDDLPQDANGVIDIAKESALQAFIDDFPTDVNGNLDIAQESTLQGFATTLSTVENDLNAAEVTLTATAAITLNRAEASNGYLYFTTSGINGVPGSWSIQSPVFAAPEFIDGGGADADQGE